MLLPEEYSSWLPQSEPQQKHNYYMKNDVFWEVTPVALVRTDVSKELRSSIIRVTKVGELRTYL
jgi:hypothetical protein